MKEKHFDVKKISTACLAFCSNFLRLITLCEKSTLFWSYSPDFIENSAFTVRIVKHKSSSASRFLAKSTFSIEKVLLAQDRVARTFQSNAPIIVSRKP